MPDIENLTRKKKWRECQRRRCFYDIFAVNGAYKCPFRKDNVTRWTPSRGRRSCRARGSRMIIRRLLLSSSQVGSTHAEDLIRSIGRADLIANTQAGRDEGREEKSERDGKSGRREIYIHTYIFGFGDNRGSSGVLISNSRCEGLRDRGDPFLYLSVRFSEDRKFSSTFLRRKKKCILSRSQR